MSGLRRKVLRGIGWRAGVSGGQQLLQVVFTIVLARLLTTADFGLVAMGLLVVRFVQALSQIGVGAAIVQDQEITDGQVSAVFYLQLVVNAGVSLACCLLAPLAAAFFGQPALTPVVRVLAWGLLLNSLAFPQVLLRKRMEFGAYSASELGSIVVANLLAILAAVYGLGVWALVVRLLVQRALFAASVWVIAGWRPVRPAFAGIGRHVRFGLNLLGSNVCYYASQNLAAILLGRFLGAETLGCFTIAFNLAVVPAQKVQSVLTSVLTPAFARLQRDLAAFRRTVHHSLFALGLFFIPAMLGLGAVAHGFVRLAYGESWKQAGVFLTFLAGVGLIKGLEHLLRATIIAAGRADVIFRITALEMAAGVPLLAAGAWSFGAVGTVAAYLLASTFSLALTVRAAQTSVGDDTLFLRATRGSLLAGALMFLAVAAYAALVPAPRGVALLTQILLGVVLYAVVRVRLLTREERALLHTWPLPAFVFSRR